MNWLTSLRAGRGDPTLDPGDRAGRATRSAQGQAGLRDEVVRTVQDRVAQTQVREVEVLGLTSGDLTAPVRKVSAAVHAIRIVVDRIRRIAVREMTADDLDSVAWVRNTAPADLVSRMTLLADLMAHRVVALKAPVRKARTPNITVPNSTIRKGQVRMVLARKGMVRRVTAHKVRAPKLTARNSTIRRVTDRKCAVPKITVLRLAALRVLDLLDVKRWVADLNQVVRRTAMLNIVSRKWNGRPNDCSTKSASCDQNSGDPMPAQVRGALAHMQSSPLAPMLDLLTAVPEKAPIEHEPTRVECRELNSCHRWNDRGEAWMVGPKDRVQGRTINVDSEQGASGTCRSPLFFCGALAPQTIDDFDSHGPESGAGHR